MALGLVCELAATGAKAVVGRIFAEEAGKRRRVFGNEARRFLFFKRMVSRGLHFFKRMDQNWYKPGKSIAEFHSSKARIRALIGARGSGKTYGIATESIAHGFWNPGAKVYILRKTQESNLNTTQETFDRVFELCGTAYLDTGFSLFKKIDGGAHYRIPSKEAVEMFNLFMASKPNKGEILRWLGNVGERWCSSIHFAGVPDAGKRDTRFRGYECSMLIFVEADQLAREDLDMALFCLRWQNARGEDIVDTCCVLDSNPPSPRHWIALMEADAVNDPKVRFWHIKMEENEGNLPPDYVSDAKRTYAKNPGMYKRMILGEYAEAFDQTGRVLWGFNEEHAYDNLPWPRGAYLVRGWDFGTTNAVVWAAYWEEGGNEYWWDLQERFATNDDAEKQAREVVRLTQEIFPFWNDRDVCAGVMDYCDPAGAAKTDKGRSIDAAHSYGIYPGFSTKFRSLQLTLAVYNRLLELKDTRGKLAYRICRSSCPMLYLASLGGYRYPNVGEVGFGRDEPGKGPGFDNYDHIADASRYAKINCLRLAKVELEKMQRPVGKLAKELSPNPIRRWR